jgi:hypothetical protein
VTAVLRYTLLRLALFVAVLAVLSLAGASELTAVIGAAVVSVLLSYVLLRGPRETAARAIAERTQARLEARSAAREAAGPEQPGSERAAAAPGQERRHRPRLQDDAAAEDARLDSDPPRGR